jgi:hypothetical protein
MKQAVFIGYLCLVLLFLAGCVEEAAPVDDMTDGDQIADGDADLETCTPGNERCECYPNKTCNAGLVCLSDLCVRLVDEDGDESDPADGDSDSDDPDGDTIDGDDPDGDVIDGDDPDGDAIDGDDPDGDAIDGDDPDGDVIDGDDPDGDEADGDLDPDQETPPLSSMPHFSGIAASGGVAVSSTHKLIYRLAPAVLSVHSRNDTLQLKARITLSPAQ